MVDSNTATSFTMGGIDVPFGAWDYLVSTGHEECQVTVHGVLHPKSAKCHKCGQPVELGRLNQHAAFYRHLAVVTIPNTFPVNTQGQHQMSKNWKVKISDGPRNVFSGPMQVMGVTPLPVGLRIRIVLECRLLIPKQELERLNNHRPNLRLTDDVE